MKIKEVENGFIRIKLTGDEVATAIDAYLVARRVTVRGPRTIHVNKGLIKSGAIYVGTGNGRVIHKGKVYEKTQ